MSQSSVGHGGKRDGAGRPKGALNLIARPVKELAAEQSEASIERLIQLRDHAESEQVRFAAAKELLDRAHGRPRQEIAVEDNSIRVIIAPVPAVNVPPRPPVLIEHQSDARQGSLDR